jgi:hypothetical protein
MNLTQMQHQLSRTADQLEVLDKTLDAVLSFLENLDLKEDDANYNDWCNLLGRLNRL